MAERAAQSPAHASAVDIETSGAVNSEAKSRSVQERNGSFSTTVKPDWMADLGLNEQGAEVDVRQVTGIVPVVIDEPCIIVRPARSSVEGFGDE